MRVLVSLFGPYAVLPVHAGALCPLSLYLVEMLELANGYGKWQAVERDPTTLQPFPPPHNSSASLLACKLAREFLHALYRVRAGVNSPFKISIIMFAFCFSCLISSFHSMNIDKLNHTRRYFVFP